MYIQDLPTELLQKIIDHVPTNSHNTLTQGNANNSSSSNHNNIDILNCALTCKKWSYYSLQLLWHKPIISKPHIWLQIQRVLMKQLQQPVSSSSSPYCNYGHFIRRINLSTVPEFISDETLQLLAHCCYQLDRLTLTGCYHLTNRGLQSFLSLPASSTTLLKHLLSIDLSDIPHLSDETVSMIAKTCRHLQGLNLSVLMNNTNSNNNAIDNSTAATATRNDSTSSSSSINSGHFQENSISIVRRRKSADDDGEDILEEAEEEDDYEEDVIGVTDRSIIELARHCKDLKRIRLSNWRSITDTAIIALAIHCPSLLEIDVVHCSITNQSLQTIFTYCGELRELKLNHCSQITDEGFLPLALNQQQQKQRFEQLRILELTNLPFITDRAIDYITQAAPKIRNLVLNKCSHITDTAVMHYITRLSHHLHYLHLGNCKHITDQAIIQLVAQCPRVRYIDLTSCHRLTDTAVVALSTLPKLKRIGLVKCHRITNQPIFALARQQPSTNPATITSTNTNQKRHHHHHQQNKTATTPPPSLERVHLSYCEQLTVPAIATFILQCRRLTHLSLSFIPAMQQEEVGQEIVQKFCRPPPREYNTPELQRTFCVFSGHKVFHELRKYFLTRQQQQQQQQKQQRYYQYYQQREHPINGGSISDSRHGFSFSSYYQQENAATSNSVRMIPLSQTPNDMYRNAYTEGERMLYQYQQTITNTTTTTTTIERRLNHPSEEGEQQVDDVTAGLERTFIL